MSSSWSPWNFSSFIFWSKGTQIVSDDFQIRFTFGGWKTKGLRKDERSVCNRWILLHSFAGKKNPTVAHSHEHISFVREREWATGGYIPFPFMIGPGLTNHDFGFTARLNSREAESKDGKGITNAFAQPSDCLYLLLERCWIPLANIQQKHGKDIWRLVVNSLELTFQLPKKWKGAGIVKELLTLGHLQPSLETATNIYTAAVRRLVLR